MHLRRSVSRLVVAAVCMVSATASNVSRPLAAGQASATQGAGQLQVPVEYFKLKNGLKVVLSRDLTTPTAVVAVYYNIGFRNEPKDKTGFSHLFEHMMFQGSQNLGKMEFIRLVESNGGLLNGSTRFDFTNYFQVVPSHVLETILWAEADRMRGLNIDADNLKNQQEVVKNEVKVNVLNQPYGGFPWIDLPMAANQNWYNAHNFYGDLAHLDAATLDDVRSFFKTFYAPNNAVLVVTGDFAADRRRPGSKSTSPTFRRRSCLRRLTCASRARRRRSAPAGPIRWRIVPRSGSPTTCRSASRPEWYAFGLIDRALAQGERFAAVRRAGAQERPDRRRRCGHQLGPRQHVRLQRADVVDGAVLPRRDDALRQAARGDRHRLERVRKEGLDQATLDRARVKMRSGLYADLEQFAGFGRANLLASFALFDDDPSRINRLEAEFAKVTPALVQKTASEYLRPGNRTVYVITPGKNRRRGSGREGGLAMRTADRDPAPRQRSR